MSMFVTCAASGPCVQRDSICLMMSSGPEITISTVPSLRLRTQPLRFRALASSIAHSRKPTPVTWPLIRRRNVVRSSLILLVLQNHCVDRQRVAGFGGDAFDRAVALGAQHVFHLHRLDDREHLA